ncbi:minor capsid protein [Orenia marismortui]|uniref:SPP1 gp7 family putative phage head morphogenesis protein n=1 Tax=Orenia marismortui TaxID=46469 RepID=A0A4R8GR31_9FIRM|nr:minor capsid protein [Orenia marismortui]TDX48286.1 SPP1 gp7 family putative phage head morphogenesis protein [Orenia marismortui]
MARLPKVKFPTTQAVDYYDKLVDLIDQMHNLAEGVFERKVRPVLRRNDSIRLDDEIDEVNRALDKIEEEAINNIFEQVVDKLANDFIDLVRTHSIVQVGNQVKAVLGFDPLKNDPALAQIAKAAVKENVRLIKSIPRKYFDDLNRIILNGIRAGNSTEEIAEEIQKLYDVTRNRAKLIARDQAGSLQGDLTKARHKNLGLKKFRWVATNDSRVRKKHDDFDGHVYTWEDGAGAGVFPGKEINCRCTASLVREELEEMWQAA